MKNTTINLHSGILIILLISISATSLATSIYTEPSDESTVNFGNNIIGSAQQMVTIITTGNGDAKKSVANKGGGVQITDIQCAFQGNDAANFSVLTSMPAGITIGESLDVDLQVTFISSSRVFLTSTLTCSYGFGGYIGSFSWPVIAAGVAGVAPQTQVVPSLNVFGIFILLIVFLFLSVLKIRVKD